MSCTLLGCLKPEEASALRKQLAESEKRFDDLMEGGSEHVRQLTLENEKLDAQNTAMHEALEAISKWTDILSAQGAASLAKDTLQQIKGE